jgi:hypothetical protein
MSPHRLALLATALALPFAHVLAASPAERAAALRDAALQDDTAWDIVEDLTTEVGQRLGGTEAEARARDWAVVRLKAMGFSNVHVEEYRMPVWVRGAETAEITGPFPQKLAVTALGNSGATPAEGLTAQIVGFDSLDDLRAVPDGSLRGKIAFIGHAMKPTQDGSGYGFFGPARFQGPAIAAAKGAAAVVIRSVGTDHDRMPHTGMTRFPQGTAPIPAGALSLPDAENLQRMLASGKPVTMRLVLTPRLLGEQLSGNVVAEVPGSDPDAGIILVGGHLDSWDLGTGAVDDGAGIAVTAAAAKRVMDAPGRPKRTIRVIWWGAEEVGVFGGADYFAKHRDEKVVLVAESDFGADRVWRFQNSLADANKPLADELARLLAPLGIASSDGKPDGGADVGAWVEAGVATVDLDQDGTRYFDLHHTANDTLDKIDPEQLRQNVAAWTAMLALVANSPESIGRSQAK